MAALLATQRRGSRPANRLLALYFLIFGLALGRIALQASGTMDTWPHLAFVLVPLELCYGPLFYLHVRVMTGHPLARRDARHLALPALALLALLPVYLASAEAKRALVALADERAVRLRIVTWTANWAVLSLYLVAALRELRLHGARLRRNLSTLGRAGLAWVRAMAWVLVAAQAVDFGGAVASMRAGSASPAWGVAALLLALLLYVLAFVALRQPEFRYERPDPVRLDPRTGEWARPTLVRGDAATEAVPIDVAAEEAAEVAGKYRRSGLSDEEAVDVAERIVQRLDRERLFIRSDLSLADLADLVGAPPHHVSQALNERLGGNFFDVINRRRVAEAQRLLADPARAHLTVLAIGFEAGFNSKTAFNTAFKAVTGVTPSDWRRRQHRAA